MSNPAQHPVALALAGPTASGKTAAALALADQWRERGGIEIISVDSALVFRGMDIGTAKPTAAELAAVPHHLIDIRDPLNAYSAAEFVRDAEALMTQIRSRGRMPLLVGGTMLYFKALRDGLDDLPQADKALRAQLDADIAAFGSPALHARLQTLDPITAARLKPNDTQRIQRAMEIQLLTGQPMSALLDKAIKVELPFTLLPFALEPSDRSVVHQRIALRLDQMLNAGPGLLMHLKPATGHPRPAPTPGHAAGRGRAGFAAATAAGPSAPRP